MWKSLRGCVIIHVNGRNTVRVLEKLRKSGVVVREAMRISPLEIRCAVRYADFFKLHALLRGSGCRVRIAGKSGARYALGRLFARKALWIGMTACALLMALLPALVLEIRIRGNARVPDAVVLRALAGQGVERFRPLPDTELVLIGTYARAYDERIAWLGLKKDGAVLHVRVVESEQNITTVDAATVCDVVAVKDGVIETVEAYAGNALVKPGDLVRAGDVLIEGVFFPETPETVLAPVRVHARGKVTARVAYVSEYTADAFAETVTDTGRTDEYLQVTLFDRTLIERGADYASYEVRDCTVQAFTDVGLPLMLVRGACYETELASAPLSEAAQRETAAAGAERISMLKVPKDAAVLQKTMAYREENGLISAVVTVMTSETIGLEKEWTE